MILYGVIAIVVVAALMFLSFLFGAGFGASHTEKKYKCYGSPPMHYNCRCNKIPSLEADVPDEEECADGNS